MTGSDIVSALMERTDEQECFIKWWRKESDFVDFELVDTFMRSGVDELEFDGYELLTMEEMWTLLQAYAANHVDTAQKGGEKLLVWRHNDGTTESLPFTAETLMQVFDTETRGDVLM